MVQVISQMLENNSPNLHPKNEYQLLCTDLGVTFMRELRAKNRSGLDSSGTKKIDGTDA